MRRLLPVLALAPVALLAGCWPHISGDWEDYAEPEMASVIGTFWWAEYRGSYWSSGTPEPIGEVWFAAFAEPKQAWPWKRYTADLGTCTRNTDLPAWWSEFADVGEGTTVVRSPDDAIELQYYPTGPAGSYAFAGLPVFQKDIPAPKLAAAADSLWSLDPLNLDGFEPLAIDEFIYVPPLLTVTSPAIGGDTPPTFSRGQDITFDYDAPEGTEYIFIEVYSTNSAGNGLEIVQCVVENTGSTTVPLASLFTSWANASALYIQIGPYTHTNDVLPGSEGGVRMGGISAVVGAGFVE